MNPEDALQRLKELQAKIAEGENAKRQMAEIQQALVVQASQNQPVVPLAYSNAQAPSRATGIVPIHHAPSAQQRQLQPNPSHLPHPPSHPIPNALIQLQQPPQRPMNTSNPVAQLQTYYPNDQRDATWHLQNGHNGNFNSNNQSMAVFEGYQRNGSYVHQPQPVPFFRFAAQNPATTLSQDNSANRLQGQANLMANASYSRNAAQYVPQGFANAPTTLQRSVPQSQQLSASYPPPTRMQPPQVVNVPPAQVQQTRPNLPNHRPSATSAPGASKPPPPYSTLPESLPAPANPGAINSKERIVHLKNMTQAELDTFKLRFASWSKTAPIGQYVDLFENFGFGKRCVVVNHANGLILVDTADSNSCPFSKLVKALEDRMIRPNRSPTSNQVVQSQASSALRTNPAEPEVTTTPAHGSQKQAANRMALSVRRSPADANKRTLARDILLALGKRPREQAESLAAPAPKRVAVPKFVNPPTISRPPLPAPSSLPPVPEQSAALPPQKAPATISEAPPPPLPNGRTLSSVVISAENATSLPSSLPLVSLHAVEAGFQQAKASALVALVAEKPLESHITAASPKRDLCSPDIAAAGPSRLSPVQGQIASLSSSPGIPPIAIIDVASTSRNSTPIQAIDIRSSPLALDLEVAQLTSRASSLSNAGAPPTSSSRNESMIMESRRPSPTMSIDKRAGSPEEALFLPTNSPPSSPALSNLPDTAAQSIFSDEVRGRNKRKQRAYVLIPPPSPRTARVMQLQPAFETAERMSGTRSNASHESSSRVTAVAGRGDWDSWPSVEEEEEYDYSFDAQGNKIEDTVERQLMKTACTRLQALPCKWDRCDVIMNSMMGLLGHLKRDHRPPPKNENNRYFSCKWHLCGKQCRYRDRHFIKHVLDCLTCPYIGCNDRLRTVGQLRRHVDKHPDNARLKPSCEPFRPKNLVPPPDAPDVLPSFMVISRQVKAASITPGRQANLYPWVLKGITGLVKVKQPRQRRHRALKGLITNGTPDDGTFDRYAFLTDYPTRYSTYLTEPGDIRVDNLPENPHISDISLAGGLIILEPGTSEATIRYAVKEESRENSPLGPLALDSERLGSPEIPYCGPVVEEEEDENGSGDDGNESDMVASMLL